jgi:leucyl/phenylalanyl-tRNA--protein transferase
MAIAEGLLAVGGDLSVERLVQAYRQGIFPWYTEDDPILWWSPDPRLVLYPEAVHVSRSLRKLMRRNRFTVTMDTAFRPGYTGLRRKPRAGPPRDLDRAGNDFGL